MNAVVKLEEQHLAVVSDSASLMAAIARAAADPNVDVGKMERLFAMHERMQARQAEQAFAEAMRGAQSDIPKIVKDRTNSQTKSDYATLDAINKVITPIYTGHGLSLSFDTEDSPLDGHVRIVCHVLHTDGHKEAYRYDTPLDSAGIQGTVNKTQTHARGSAVTYGRRYLTLMIFNLTTGPDDDGNSAGGKVDPNQEWLDAVATIIDMHGYEKMLAEVTKAFGSRAKVPQAVQVAFGAAKSKVAGT